MTRPNKGEISSGYRELCYSPDDLDSILLILAPPWPPSTTEDDKLFQILEHIKKLDRKVNVQDGVIAQQSTQRRQRNPQKQQRSSESLSGDSRRR